MADRSVAVLAWAPTDARVRALADALGGDARAFFDLSIVSRPLVPLRYLLSAARTLAYLLRRRPRAVVVQAPPVPAAAVAWAYARLARVPVVIDSHPAAFALEGVPIDRLMLPLLRRLARRSAALIVTTPELARRVEAWPARALVPPEAPVRAPQHEASSGVLFVSTFAPAEPLAAVLAVAAALPDVRFRITGDVRRRPPGMPSPPNVEWLGYLAADDYRRTLGRSAVILSLTTRQQAVLRSAYEAVYALRPLVVSDWPHMRELFPNAIHVTNDASAIAAGVREACARRGELEAAAADARTRQVRRWEGQLSALREVLGR